MGSFHARTGRLLWLVALLLTAPIAMAESPSAPNAPPHLVLKGYDPVAYFTDGKPTLGKIEFEMEFDRSVYRFASARHMELFKADPDRYMPQFGGSCTGLMSKNIKMEANPEHWILVDGRLYVFLSPVDRQRSPEEFDRLTSAARSNWEALKDQPFR